MGNSVSAHIYFRPYPVILYRLRLVFGGKKLTLLC